MDKKKLIETAIITKFILSAVKNTGCEMMSQMRQFILSIVVPAWRYG